MHFRSALFTHKHTNLYRPPSHSSLKLCAFECLQSSSFWHVGVENRVGLPKVPPSLSSLNEAVIPPLQDPQLTGFLLGSELNCPPPPPSVTKCHDV